MMLLKEEAGMRIDTLLAKRFPDYSRTYFQYLIESGAVKINGKPVKKKDKTAASDLLEVTFIPSPEIALTPQEMHLDVLYEDEHLIAVNKPSGLIVHPGAGNRDGTFVNGLIHYLKQVPEGGEPSRPGIVHRLDKETSGVLLAAKTSHAHARLVDMFKERKMEKEYLAVCKGRPKEGWINAPIGRHPVKRALMCVKDDGKEALTHIEILDHRAMLFLIRARPKTGRTHQIRVHLKHLGAPVLGDALYGCPAKRMFLHAETLSFTHPITKTPLTIKAPIPQIFILKQFEESIFFRNRCFAV